MNDSIAVYGIGNVLIDLLVRVSEEDILKLGLTKGGMHLTDGAERDRLVEFIRPLSPIHGCGGSAPNTIITLAALGVSAGLSGKIGNDDFGRAYSQRLTEHGVINCLSVGAGDTGSSIILITPDSQRTMNTSLCANRTYSVSDIDPEAIEAADYFFFTGYMWDTEGQKQALTRAIDIAKAAGTRIVFDAADTFAVLRAEGEFPSLIKDHFDIVLANAEEGRILFDGAAPEEASRRLADLCDIAVIKDGCSGSIIRQGGRRFHIPADSVETVDTTGAGDIYAAGLIYGLSSGWEVSRAGLFASFLAGQIVRYTGAQFSPEAVTDIRRKLADGSWDFT